MPEVKNTEGIIDLTQAELDNLDLKTRKLLTASHALHKKSEWRS